MKRPLEEFFASKHDATFKLIIYFTIIPLHTDPRDALPPQQSPEGVRTAASG